MLESEKQVLERISANDAEHINMYINRLQEKAESLTQALIKIKNCPESDLAKYCEAVDTIACEALAANAS